MLSDLPEEMMLQIAGYLSPLDTLELSSASHQLRRVCGTLLSNLSLHFPDEPSVAVIKTWEEWDINQIVFVVEPIIWFSPAVSYFFDKRCSSLEIICNYGLLDIKVVLYLLKRTSNLTTLKLCGIKNMNNEFLDSIFKSIPSIRELYFTGSFQFPQQDTWDGRRSQPSSDSNGTKKFMTLIRSLNRIERLDLGNCTNISDEILLPLFLVNSNNKTFSSQLTSLNIDGAKITEYCLGLIINDCLNLSSLSVSRCIELSNKCIGLIEKAHNLKSLTMQQLKRIKNISGLEKCESLATLDISGCFQITSIDCLLYKLLDLTEFRMSGLKCPLEPLAAWVLPKLKTLDLKGCFSVNNNFLTRLKTPNLRSISIGSCIQLTDEAITQFILNTPHLVQINLEWIKKISFTFFTETRETLSWLQTLNLSHTNLSDKFLKILASTKPYALKTLQISMCKNVTDNGVTSISYLTAIQHLDISQLSLIKDFGIAQLSKKLHRLKHLNLNGCILLTDRSLNYLSRCKRLQYLDITQCPELSNEGVTALELPHLRDLRYNKDMSDY